MAPLAVIKIQKPPTKTPSSHAVAPVLSALGHKWTFVDVCFFLNDVRFTPESGHVQCN